MTRIPETERAIRVFVGDASYMTSQLLVTALQRSRQRIAVVGAAVDSMGIRKMLRENCADIAVIGSGLKDGPVMGFEVVKEIRASYSLMRIVVMLESAVAPLVVEAFRAGAHGILSHDDSFEVLCKCIRAVQDGQIWANSEQLHFVIEALAKSAPSEIKSVLGAKLLTRREEGLVELVARGLTNRDISKQLNLSEHTVRNYLFRIFNKLGTSNRLELALYSIHRSEGASMSRGTPPA